ncbi:glycosyl hydrolase family 18 protein [Niabella sp. 22666]|uniref:glycosyl hydrolase family 18 protein n=1 Tax=Niabella sp. 22666 TaxID=3453954 RepID=UPI003F863278
MIKKIFIFLAAASIISLVLYSCSKKDVIDNALLPCTSNTAPANGSSISTPTVTLSWKAVSGATSYDIYIGTSPSAINLVAPDVSGSSYNYTLPSGANATYHWYVVPKANNKEATGCASSVTSFTYGTAPATTTNISPANGATTLTNSITLQWKHANGATAYDLFLGTSAATATVIASNLTDSFYVYNLPAGTLSNNYYWYVQPKNSLGNAQNPATTATSFKYHLITPPPAMGFMVIQYFPSYRSVTEYPDRMFKMCNVVNYAFAPINASSTVDVPASATFNALYTKAKTNGAKVFLSVNATAANFILLRDATRRNTLVKDLMNKARSLSLDGIDMDYEYPRTTDGTDTVFALLMKELSDSLHTDGKYYLSAAITPGRYAGAVRDGLKNEVFAYTDFFNVMVYDDFSTSVPYKHHSNMDLVNYCTNYWINTRGMPKEKFVLGIPAYGRNSGATQVSTSFKTILSTGTQLGPSPVHLSDSATITRTDGTTFTTYYTGHESTKQKALSAKTNGGGFMFWEMGHDANDDNALLKVACDAIGKTY